MLSFALKKQWLFLSLSCVVMFSYNIKTIAAVVDTAEWGFTSTFSEEDTGVHPDGWYVSPIEAKVWSISQKSDYGDIRIVNSKNEEIPYVLIKQGVVAKTDAPVQKSNSQAKIIENTLQSNQGIPERVIVLDTSKEGSVYTGMHFDTIATSKNFRKTVHVYISDTLLGATSPAWREIEQKGIIYNYTDSSGFTVEDTDINFPNMASRYIKVRFEDDLALKGKGVAFLNQVAISGVRMQYEQKDTTNGIKIENYVSGNFSFDDADPYVASKNMEKIVENKDTKSTEIYLADIQAATSIQLSVDKNITNFNRDITIQGSRDNTSWQTVASGQIYRIDSPIYHGEVTRIPTPVLTYPFVRIIVQNKNDTALTFQHAVGMTSQKIGILFKAEGVDVSDLKFLIGNKKATTPTYEIQKTLPYFKNMVPIQVTLRPIEKNTLFISENVHVPFGEKYKNLVNTALVMFVALLAYLGYSWTRKTR